MNHPTASPGLMFALVGLPVLCFGEEPRGVPEQKDTVREQRLESMRAQAAAFEVSFIEKAAGYRLRLMDWG